MSVTDFDILEKLGEGAYSTVFKVRRRSDGKIYALKKVRFMPLKEKEKENAVNEVRILASISHPNVVGYKEAFIDESTNTLCLVMEYADNGDLLQRITNHQKRSTFFSENEIWDIFIQAVRGLKALHDLNILHRDLKCANLFMCSDGIVKLGDMNVSKVAKLGLVYTQTGTPYYASPEVWKDKPYDSKSDIWSLGCVIYETASLNPPFRATDMKGLYRKVIKGDYPPLPSRYSNQLAEMIKLLLKVNPSHRPTCDEILALPMVAQRNSRIQHDNLPENNLLGTIKIPRQMKGLANNLPASTYEKDRSFHSVPAVSKRHGFMKETATNSDGVSTRNAVNTQKSRVYSEKEIRAKETIQPKVVLPEVEPLRPYNADRRQDYEGRPRPGLKPPQVVSHSPFAQGTIAQRIQALKAQYDNLPPGIGVNRQGYVKPNVQPSWWG